MPDLFPPPPPPPAWPPPGPLVIAATGHRPPRLGLDYGPAGNECLTRFARNWLAGFLREHPVACVWTGLAQGWDQAVAHAAVLCGLETRAAVVHGQAGRWPPDARRRYDALCSHAAEVRMSDAGDYHERNAVLVDHAGLVVALWDGRGSGTGATVALAHGRGLGVLNLWADWQKEPRPSSRWAGG